MAELHADMPVPLSTDSLPQGWGPWDLPNGWQYEPAGGPGGTPALCLNRTNPNEYLNARLPMKLPAGSRYRVTASIRVESGDGVSGHAGVEFFDTENRYLGGGHLPAVLIQGEWVEGQAEFTVPEYTHECRLMFYLRAGRAGMARFALPGIGPAPFRWTAYPLTPVRDELPAHSGRIEFVYFSQGAEPGLMPADSLQCRVELLTGTDCRLDRSIPIRNNRFTLEFGRLPAGPAQLRFTLLDAEGQPRGVRTFPVTIVTRKTVQDRMRSGCVMDPRGRLRIRNRPFLPIGLYMGGIERAELKDLSGTAINCLMPYGSCELRFADSPRQGIPAIREVMDACEAQGIKIIFSLAGAYDELAGAPVKALGVTTGDAITRTAVEEFGKHPALLAWYINDEQPVERIPALMERRRLIRQLDPLHPIYAVMCQVPEFPLYSGIVDVYGIDPYPIVDPGCNHIRISRYAHDMAQLAVRSEQGTALWTVVQAHNIGAYDPKAMQDPAFYREAFRDPSFDEILALALLAAIRGARGFLFYSYPDLATPKFDEAARPKRWSNVKRVAQTLRDLEPYLLSDTDAERIELRVLEGTVEACGFRDDTGRTCILIVGIGPGLCRAELSVVGSAVMTSTFQRTSAQGDGWYRFEGRDVCADVLY